MARLKRFTPRGLALRPHDLVREGDNASDLLNVQLNAKGELQKRDGYVEQIDDSESTLDLVRYGTGGDSLIRVLPSRPPGVPNEHESPIQTVNGPSVEEIPTGYDEALTIIAGTEIQDYTVPVDHAEYNSVLYITDPALQNPLMKYDGHSFYRAGMKKVDGVTFTPSGTGGDRYVRTFFSHVDAQKNITNGDYEQSGKFTNTNNVLIDYTTLRSTLFDTASLVASASGSVATGGSIPVTSHTCRVGNHLIFLSGATGITQFVVLTVTAVTPTSVTVTFDSSFGSLPYAITQVLSNTWLRCFTSADENFGYVESSSSGFTTGNTVDNSFAATGIDFNVLPLTGSEMAQVYGLERLKGLPPFARYITIFNNIMVLGGVISSINTDPSLENKEIPDEIHWSDLSVGSTVETFAPFDNARIGKTSEGSITGLYSNQDYLAVFKRRGLYYINGNLFLGNFRVNNVYSDGIGCVSHKTIKELNGSAFFLSDRGVFVYRAGSDPKEISDIIEPLFTEEVFTPALGLDLEDSFAAVDIKNEKYILFINGSSDANSRVVVYDYYYSSWFLWDNVVAKSGLIRIIDQIFFSDGNKIYGFRDRSVAITDNGANISATYKSSWEHIQEPSLDKKFIELKVFSLGSTDYTLGIKSEIDWIETTKTDETLEFTSSARFLKHKLSNDRASSIRITFENSANEDMLITGWEHEFELVQRDIKR